MNELAPGIFAELTGYTIGNMGAFVIGAEVVFIDSGLLHPRSALIREELEVKGYTPSKILLTHYHADHFFGSQGLGEIELVSSRQTAEICREMLESEWRSDSLRKSIEASKDERPELWEAVQDLQIKAPASVFDSSLSLDILDKTVEMKRYGGHTAGSSVVIIEPDHAIFTGDLVFSHEFPYAGDPSNNIDEWIDALSRIIRADFDLIIPGHGPVCDNEELERHIAFLQELKSRVIEAVSEGIDRDTFLQEGLVPDFYEDTTGKRTMAAIARFYDFYSKGWSN